MNYASEASYRYFIMSDERTLERRAQKKACAQEGVRSRRRALMKACAYEGVHSRKRALKKLSKLALLAFATNATFSIIFKHCVRRSLLIVVLVS